MKSVSFVIFLCAIAVYAVETDSEKVETSPYISVKRMEMRKKKQTDFKKAEIQERRIRALQHSGVPDSLILQLDSRFGVDTAYFRSTK